MLVRFLLPLAALALAAPPARAQQSAEGLTLTGVRRVYSDNSQWTLSTSKGDGTLRRVYSDNSQWELRLPGHAYTIRHAYSDDFSWDVSEAGHPTLTIKTAYSQNPNEWSVGPYQLRTSYRDHFNEWDGGGLRLRCAYSDCTSWDVSDGQPRTDPAVKAAMLFVVVLEGSVLKH